MKTLFTFLAVLLALVAFAFPQRAVISGQGSESIVVYWGTSTDSSLKDMWLVDKHYHDSAGTWVRDDNRADSCSRPFWIASDGGTYPIWKFELETRRRAVDKDSGAYVYRVETRYVQNSKKATYWGWRRKGMLNGYQDVSVTDSVVLPTPLLVTKSTVAGLFFVTGDQGRLCPDELAGTANGTTDSIFGDTTLVRRQ